MKSTIRFVTTGALALLLAACGGSQESVERPTLTMSSVQAASIATPASAYNDVVQRVYVGYFGRPADPAGLEFWSAQYATHAMPLNMADISATYSSNAGVRAFVDAFGTSQESADLYPGDNAAFVSAIYRNLFNREPDAAGKAYWVDVLDRGIMTRAIAALYIMSGAQSTDITIIDKKIEIAKAFTTALNTDARRSAYSGMIPSAIARTMLSSVGLATDTATFTGVATTIATLESRVSTSKLAAYLGTWAGPCDMYSKDSVVITESPGSANTVFIKPVSEYYDTPTCDGPVIATLTLSADVVAVHTGTANTSAVFDEGGPIVPATVDLISVTMPGHTMSVTGPNVVHTVVDGDAQWCVDMSEGFTSCIMDPGFTPAQGPESGGLHVSGNTMYVMSLVGNIYMADETYTRK